MGNAYSKEFDNIRKDLKRIKNITEKELCLKAEFDMVKMQKNIVTLFYKSYTPNSYKRKNDLYDSLLSHNIRNNTARITIGGKNMYSHGRHGEYSGDYIFNLIWNEGIRGLPYMGTNELTKSYCFYDHHFEAGEIWRNPYWSGEQEPWKNIFMPRISYGNVILQGTPNDVYEYFIENWWEVQGLNYCEKLIKNV